MVGACETGRRERGNDVQLTRLRSPARVQVESQVSVCGNVKCGSSPKVPISGRQNIFSARNCSQQSPGITSHWAPQAERHLVPFIFQRTQTSLWLRAPRLSSSHRWSIFDPRVRCPVYVIILNTCGLSGDGYKFTKCQLSRISPRCSVTLDSKDTFSAAVPLPSNRVTFSVCSAVSRGQVGDDYTVGQSISLCYDWQWSQETVR